MYSYDRFLQYPVNIKTRNPMMAQVIISQYGGADGEIGASLRYMSQKYAMKNKKVAGLLNDIATEEVAIALYHLHAIPLFIGDCVYKVFNF